MKEDLPYSDGVETTKAWARTHTDEIEEVAARTIEEAGYDYPVKARLRPAISRIRHTEM